MGIHLVLILIGGVLLLTCMVLALVYAWRTGMFARQLKVQVVIGVAVLVYVGGLAMLTLGGGGELRTHSTTELYHFGARVHDYFVPFAWSKLFGPVTCALPGRHLHGSNFAESGLYLGLVLMQLAVIALAAAFARWSPPGCAGRRLPRW